MALPSLKDGALEHDGVRGGLLPSFFLFQTSSLYQEFFCMMDCNDMEVSSADVEGGYLHGDLMLAATYRCSEQNSFMFHEEGATQ